MSLKITAFCPTLNRPELLGRLIKCFEHQTYDNRELIILDDGGQYESGQKGDRWELISVPRRFRTLGEKNNAAMAMASFDSKALAKADDDDIYAPWWLESLADALGRAEVVQPKLVVDFVGGEWEVENVVVRPVLRRQGVGVRLLDEIISRARQADADAVFHV